MDPDVNTSEIYECEDVHLIQMLRQAHADRGMLLEALAAQRAAGAAEELERLLNEIMPRYREMFEALGLGDFTKSVVYQMAIRAQPVAPPEAST